MEKILVGKTKQKQSEQPAHQFLEPIVGDHDCHI